MYVKIFSHSLNGDFTWRGVWLLRISGGYSQGMMGFVLGGLLFYSFSIQKLSNDILFVIEF